jgi:hypothetical protein
MGNAMESWAVAAVLLVLVVSFCIVVSKLIAGRRRRVEPTEEQIEALDFIERQEREDTFPRCVCGEIATHTAPNLVRSRTGFLRSFFAMPPSYKRKVKDADSWLGPDITKDDLKFCETHAHVADAMLDRFIYHEVRDIQAETNEKIAVRAAAFEQEGLVEAIRESLTDKQKRSVRKGGAPVRVLPRPTGTDEPGVQSTEG